MAASDQQRLAALPNLIEAAHSKGNTALVIQLEREKRELSKFLHVSRARRYGRIGR